MPKLDWVTSDSAYVRLHGRNKEKWHEHEEAWERYDYSYSPAELAEWAGRIKELGRSASRVYVYFNNHFHGKAARNALELKAMLGQEVKTLEEQGKLF
jgi:uncharacterized protein YecE (DUF72 family)